MKLFDCKILLCATVAVSGCSHRDETAPAATPASVAADSQRPVEVEQFRMWSDYDSVDVLKLAGIEAEVYRWEHGIPELWAQFDEPEQPEKRWLNFGGEFLTQMKEKYPNENVTLRQISGVLLVTKKADDNGNNETSAENWVNCSVSLQFRYKTDEHSTAIGQTVAGKLRLMRNAPPADPTPGNTEAQATDFPNIQFQPSLGSSSDGNTVQFFKSGPDIKSRSIWMEVSETAVSK